MKRIFDWTFWLLLLGALMIGFLSGTIQALWMELNS